MVVALFGPTAVGKTDVAIELAELLRERGEQPVAVSADALQVYSGLDVLAAKPSDEQLERLEHRLISFVPIERSFSVGEFTERAHREIDSLLEERCRPIVVGGTGLYLRAALTELALKPPPGPGLREEVERDLEELGLKALHAQLPSEVAGAVSPNDRSRIVRALELERMGEHPYVTSDQLWSEQLRTPTRLFAVVMDRAALDERIVARVDSMLVAGALQEVESALERGASATARKAIGFRELEAHLAGTISLAEAGERIKRRHRQYVKRQLTWMRKLAGVTVVDRTGLSAHEVASSLAAGLKSDRDPLRSG
jgi:tRNA dimethylallyltransferase